MAWPPWWMAVGCPADAVHGARPGRHPGADPAIGAREPGDAGRGRGAGSRTDRLTPMRVAIGSDHAGFALKGSCAACSTRCASSTATSAPSATSRSTTPTSSRRSRARWRVATSTSASCSAAAARARRSWPTRSGIRCVQATNPVAAGARAQRRQRHLVRGADRGPRWRGPVCASSWPLRSRAVATSRGWRRSPHRGRGGGSLGAWPWRSTTTSVRCWPASMARAPRWRPAWSSARPKCWAPIG